MSNVMALGHHEENKSTTASIDLPDELVSNIFLHCSTPAFIQLTRTSKRLYDLAQQRRPVLLHHLEQLPGDKADLDDPVRDNAALFLLLRQRAANNLYGCNITANLTEYVAKTAGLDPSACAIDGLDADYVRLALVYKDSTDIRQYTSHGVMKEKIKQQSGVKVLKLVQWGRYISVLCSWPKERENDFSDDSDYSSCSESETEMLIKRPYPPSANSRLQKSYYEHKDSKIGMRRKPRPASYSKHNYRICHYDIYTIEDSQTFEIEGYLDFVPRDFAVKDALQCAILWDADNTSGRPTDEAVVINYSSQQSQLMYAAKYEARSVWPKKKPERRGSDTEDEETPEFLPERIDFFKEGRRIKIYDAGGVVPYLVVSTTTHDPYSSTNVINFDGLAFYVDTPFYGTHARHKVSEYQEYCFQTHLCLGVTTIDMSEDEDEEQEVRVLCILRSQNKLYPENCDHRVSLERMAHVSAGNSTVVARLWGWEEMHTNLTGKETIAISSGGTRIAIAMWDKVLIYALNPKVLCEEVVVEDSDDELSKLKKKKKKPQKPWERPATDYYQRKKDPRLCDWKIAELRPVVIELEGAVAHKMSWSAPKGKITDTADFEPEMIFIDPAQDVVVVEEDEGNESETTVQLAEASIEVTGPSETILNATASPVAAESIEAGYVEDEAPENTQQEALQVSEVVPVSSPPTSVASQQVITEATQSVPSASETQTVSTINTEPQKTEIDALTDPAQPVSPSSPPLVANTKSEMHQVLPMGLPISSPSSPPPQAGLAVLPSLSQASKPSARKKEKAPEITNLESQLQHGFEKDKIQSAYAPKLKHKASTEISAPSSPMLSKTVIKQKQTVSEALTSNTSAGPLHAELFPPQIQATEGAPSHVPTVSSSEAQPALDPAVVPTLEKPTTMAAKEEVKEPEESSHSKDVTPSPAPTPNVAMISATTQDAPADETNDEKNVPPVHRKRITEDELIVLTDRGIQVWNIGARAKGIRKKKVLPMEESLEGRLPSLKQKSVGTDVPEHDEA